MFRKVKIKLCLALLKILKKNMLNYIKNTFTNFASYMLGLNEQLKNAKNDAERVKILNQIVAIQRERIDGLDDENKNLKEENAKLKERNQRKDLRIKELEEKQKSVDLGNLRKAVKDLTNTAEQSKKAFTEFGTKIEVIKKQK